MEIRIAKKDSKFYMFLKLNGSENEAVTNRTNTCPKDFFMLLFNK